MQPLLLILLLARMITILAIEHPSIIDFNQLPACARACKILSISELNCVPPAAPVSNNATYFDCFCQSGYLKQLHQAAIICDEFCSKEDDEDIYHWYNTFCGTPHFPKSTSAIPSSTLKPASQPTGIPPTTEPFPGSHDGSHEISVPETWDSKNWKHLVIIGVLVFSACILTLAIVLSKRFYTRKREQRNRANTSQLIPLRLVDRHRRPTSRSQVISDPFIDPPRDLGQRPSPSLSSFPESPAPAYSLGDSLRLYAGERQQYTERRNNILGKSYSRELLDERMRQYRLRYASELYEAEINKA